MGIQPILPITVTVKKIKDAAHKCYGDGDGVVLCERAFKVSQPSGRCFDNFQK